MSSEDVDIDALEKSEKMVKGKKKECPEKNKPKKPRSKAEKTKTKTKKPSTTKPVKKKSKTVAKPKARSTRVRGMKRPAAVARVEPEEVHQDQEQGEEEEKEYDQELLVEPAPSGSVTRTRKPPMAEPPVDEIMPVPKPGDVPKTPSESATKQPEATGALAPEVPCPKAALVQPRREIAESQEPTESQPSTLWYHGFIIVFSWEPYIYIYIQYIYIYIYPKITLNPIIYIYI